MRKFAVLLSFLVFCASTSADAVFDVPVLDSIRIDGKADDWGDRGFRVGVLASESKDILPASDFNADFRLGWDNAGLLLLLKVDDDTAVESPDVGSLWNNDSVELFVAAKVKSPDYCQIVISPGLDPKFPDLRNYIADYRKDKTPKEKLTFDAARTRTDTGYIMEVMMPWDNLNIKPEPGEEVGFQLYVNDSDDPSERFQVIWYPRSGTHADSSAMYSLRLSEKPGDPILVSALGKYELMSRIRINVSAVPDLMGKKAELRDGDRVIAQGELLSENGRASAVIRLSIPPRGESYDELTVVVDGKYASTFTLPDINEGRAWALIEDTEIHFKPSVFSGTQFPSCDFDCPLWGEALVGQYKIKTTFYDSEYNEVKTAQNPGRYGAVVEITPENGKVIRRFRTLFRQAEPFEWWDNSVMASMVFPEELGINPDVVVEQNGVIRDMLKSHFMDGINRNDRTAPLLAGLYEIIPGNGEAGFADDVWARDRQWWVGLKRKLYGMDAKYPGAFTCPGVIDQTAKVLHEGTLAEAGMKPDAVKNIDTVCQQWADDSDEGFAVCVARHGVIVLHKAYGKREGRPMTVNEASWMASITKLLGGTLMMMLVDQGLVSLDDPVDKFLPAFEGIEVKTPLNIRHLYVHTNGLWGHWGDDINDFDELIADFYPYLKVGQYHSYNGAGYAIAGKVIEMVSGEAVPQFFKNHLLDPLGCTNTRVTTMSWDTFSIPMDIARIGQMLLNKGKYGNMQFFSEETFGKMLPIKLDAILGPETNVQWGIGVTWYGEGLGEGTFGHGAASAATLRIDPVNDLVIVMTRNSAGSNFGKYHPQFIKAIVDGLETR